MASFYDAQEFRGNQGGEEEVDVILVEPITMIVPLELQDLPITITPESSASSSAGGGSSERRSSTSSSDSSTEEAPSEAGGVEEVGCNVPADDKYNDGGGCVRRVQSGAAPRSCGWRSHSEGVQEIRGDGETIPDPQNHLDLSWDTKQMSVFSVEDGLGASRLGMPVKAVVLRSLFLSHLRPSTSGTRWINNELAARLSEWRTPNAYMNYLQLTVGDIDLKNQLLDHVKARGLVDLEALVTREQLALLGFVNMTNLHAEGEMSSILERQRQRAQGSRNRGARTSMGPQPALATVGRPANMPPAPTREVTELAPTSSSIVGPRIAYLDCFSYVITDCQAAMVQGMQSFVPPANRQHAKGHVQQHGGHAALLKLMDAFSFTVALFECNQGTRSLEMANRAVSTESQADELACKVNERREELEKAQAEKESGIQVAKEEAGHAKDRAKKVESNREKTLHELNALKDRVSEADLHIAQAEASLEKTKRLHQRDACFARAQGAEWLVGADTFKDAIAVASTNTTTNIFNEVRGKVLRHQADFLINELAFFKGEEIDEEGKSLALPTDTRVRLKWELNEKGLPVWPPFVIEEGEDIEGMPSFDAWVAEPQDVPAKPSNTPPSSQPAPATTPTLSPPDRPSPARSVIVPTDASIPVNLTDD
ncbi:hypothetical protein SLEP1_g48418 [Rubroshorea leprosula]|uniref:Uncharacterized protein n=1 Tax=Rubroshorea leprosula TaxID=152421 RepID=A0AAV5LUH5_9ROSI|nr:hypothetical protein SLEP1_g48418 [Rubroshorea leprosula]